VPAHLDGNKIAVRGAPCRFGCDRKFAAKLFLVDRNKPAASSRKRAENSERAMFGAVNELYDASGGFLSIGSLDAKERTIADAGDFVGTGAARRMDADHRRRAVELFVPFGRASQELAVAVAASDVRKHNRRQSASVTQPFAPPIDTAFIGQIPQHTLERGAIGILGAEGARNLPDADLAAAFTDERDKFLA
jgi:hypothetical protein